MSVKVKIKSKKKIDSKIVAKIAIFTEDGSVLLLKRSGYMRKHKGEWDLPGGHLHKGEDALLGLSREVKEETNLELPGPVFVFKDKNDYFYVDDFNKKTIRLSDEHSSFIFYNANRIHDLKSLTNYYKSAVAKCYEVFKVRND